MKTITLNHLLCIAGLAFAATGCAPVFSELQSARTVGKNRVEITPSFSSVSFGEDGDNSGVQNHAGAQIAYGLTPKIDIRLRYEYIWLKAAADEGVSIMGFGPKFSLWEDKIAFSLPVGKIISDMGTDINGEKPNTWQLHPTLLFTAPVIKEKLDLNFSPKYLATLCTDCEDLVAVNFGLAFSSNLNKWAIRPEYGLLFSPAESGHYSHFSIGFSAAFGK